MNVRYRVELSQVERSDLKALLSGGKHASRKLKRAQILLAADAGAGDEEIAMSVGVSGSTVYRFREGRQDGRRTCLPSISFQNIVSIGDLVKSIISDREYEQASEI